MQQYIRVLQDLEFSAGNDTGTKIDLSKLQLQSGGKELYVEEIRFRLKGYATKTSNDDAGSVPAGRVARLFRRLSLSIPEVEKPLLDISGINKARLYRAMHRGKRFKGTERQTIAAKATSIPLDFTIVHRWAYGRARRAKDFSLATRLLRDGVLKVEWGDLKDLHAEVTAVSAKLEVVFVCQPRAEVQRPSVVCEEELTLDGIEPKVTPVAGRVSHLLIGGHDGARIEDDEITEFGCSFGTHRISEHSQDPSVFYENFNDAAIEGETVKNHLDATNAEDDFFPIVFDPANTAGQRQTHDVVNGALPVSMRLKSPPKDYDLVRRVILFRGEWTGKLNAKAGVLPGTAPVSKTASHKATNSAEVSSTLPEKATQAA